MTRPSLKQLQTKWYEKLKEEDFDDIEDTGRSDRPLKDWHHLRFLGNPNHFHVEKYYQQARALLHSYAFESPLHRTIWQLHSEGFSKRKIETLINSALKRERIGIIINLIQLEIK